MLACVSATSAQAEDVRARYQAATELTRQGKVGPASEELEWIARGSSPLADRASYEAGLLFERRGAFLWAARLFAAVPERSSFFLDARLAQARVLRLHGDFEQAVAAVTPLISGAVRKRALIELTLLAGLMGDGAAERQARSTLLLARSPWLGGAPALALMSGAFDPLLRRNACRDAQRAAQRAPAESGCVAQLLAAEARACVDTDVSVELERIARECPQAELSARASMAIAVLRARRNDEGAATAAFRRVSLATSSPLAAEALFAAFWVGWSAHPATASTEDLLRLEALAVDLGTQDRARIRYWRARAAQAQGSSAEAGALLGEVALLYPATWYAHLARERLTALEPLSTAVDLQAVLPTDDAEAGEPEALERLAPGIESVTMGLDDAATQLTNLARRVPSRASNRIAVEVLDAAGLSQQAHRFARAVLREQSGQSQDALVWEAAYPTRFSGLIARTADEENVARGLVQALVREESAFDPAARSRCGALGLMQLMPVTARALAFERGNPLERARDLLEPQRNVQLGAGYLGRLLRRFAGSPAAAAAAYNGGPTRVAGWLKVPRAGQLEEWVEILPLDETRNYVKDVVGSADLYEYKLAARPLVASAGVPMPAQP